MILTEVKNQLSIFKVLKNEHDVVPYKLNRLVDIIDGKLVEPIFDRNEQAKFSNRRQIFLNQEESIGISEGMIGVWRWSATHNQNDYEKDFITKTFQPDIMPIRVVVLDDLLKNNKPLQAVKMIEKNRIRYTSADVMLSWKTDKSAYNGLLIRRKDTVDNNGKMALKQSVYSLPLYSFSSKDLIIMDTHNYFSSLDILYDPIRYASVKDQISIVKDVFIEKINWSDFKSKGFTRQEYQNIKNYIATCDKDAFLEDVKSRCSCSEDEAKKLIREFTQKVSDEVVAETVTDETLLQLINRSPALQIRIDQQGNRLWKEQHAADIEKADEEMQQLKQSIDQQKKEILSLDSKINDKKRTLNEVESNISEYEKLSSEIEGSIAKKIADAKANISDFVGELTFLSSLPINIQQSVKTSSEPSKTRSVVKRGVQIEGEPDVNNHWKDELQCLEAEMKEAGIGAEHEASLAATMYACFVNKYPVMLAGPFGESIARAFSVSLNNCLPAVIDCRDGISPEIFDDLDEMVVLIKNPFEPGARDIVLQAISEHENYFILTTPLFDDLKIEPVSILDYFFPISTTMFVKNMPQEDFLGGTRAAGFLKFQRKVTNQYQHTNQLRKMGINGFAQSRITSVISDARYMNPRLSEGYEYLYFLITLALMTSNEIEMKMFIEKHSNNEAGKFANIYLGDE